MTGKTADRIRALVQTACKLITEGAPETEPEFLHRLDKVDTKEGLASTQALAKIGVPYPARLYERFLGRPFAGYRDAVSELVGDVIEAAIENLLSDHGISYRKTKRAERVTGFDQAPDFIIPDEFNPVIVIEAKLAEDDGTARDKVTRVQHLDDLSTRGREPGDPRYEREGNRMHLTDQQIHFFHTFGYLAFPGLLDDCIGEVTDEFEAIWAAHGGGHHGRPHDETMRSCIYPFLDRSARLSALLDDPRILAIASPLVGEDFNYMGSDGNYYAGDTGWHSDDWTPDFLRIKIALYLDPLTRDTGCLRVIPGSHHIGDKYADGLMADTPQSREVWGIDGRAVPAIALETQPGDVLCFNQNCKHASFGGGSRRRMFTLNFSPRYPDHRLQDLRDYCSAHTRFWIDHLYGETLIRTATPERMRHLEQVMANDSHMAELSRRAREEMVEPAHG